ncbi:hypothetical protein [Aeromicrobium sp. IC_218]|uniref:hypothetical protein n=1 Tax=Aeromicrobium sp. IC_218 TaxID=2545468 RepID=UPI00103E8BCE|nr:hypothetical protein [Aeromicrobium sp. IC_218]TCI96959.1 hypothetical protein E0W78_13035 [Aeromicrobium sp. IC_218]
MALGVGLLLVDRACAPEVRAAAGVQLTSGYDPAKPQPYDTIYVDDLCVEGADRATVIGVEPVRAKHMSVTAFGLHLFKSDEPGIGAQPGPLVDTAVEWSHEVDATCSGPGSQHGPTSLNVEVHRDAPGDGIIEGLRILYRVGDAVHTVESDAVLEFCQTDACFDR